MINRRNLVLAGACLAGCGVAYAAGKQPTGRASNFVRVEGARFVLKNRTYRYVGTNLWYGAYIGSFVEGRKRLCRELDMLGALGSDSPLAHPGRGRLDGAILLSLMVYGTLLLISGGISLWLYLRHTQAPAEAGQ